MDLFLSRNYQAGSLLTTMSGLCITKKITEIPQCRIAIKYQFLLRLKPQYLDNNNWQNKTVFMNTALQLRRAVFQVFYGDNSLNKRAD